MAYLSNGVCHKCRKAIEYWDGVDSAWKNHYCKECEKEINDEKERIRLEDYNKRRNAFVDIIFDESIARIDVKMLAEFCFDLQEQINELDKNKMSADYVPLSEQVFG